ncbi:MAG: nitroreductase family protein [Gammaproteobacteria bacterium]|nr:nitroreductase family protein [Gammaproteobacteria bacterium]
MSDSVFEIMHNTRAMRRLKNDPVPDELVDQILQAGACAPSGGNRQNWGFIVVRDAEIKRQIQVFYRRAFDDLVGPHYASSAPPPGMSGEQFQRQHAAVEYLTDHFHEAPVWIVACLDSGDARPHRGSGASIYPAVQNMLLAARALGLGATLTTRHVLHGAEVDAILKLPEGVDSYAIVPIGYPIGRFGPVNRSMENIVFSDTWGQPRTGEVG